MARDRKSEAPGPKRGRPVRTPEENLKILAYRLVEKRAVDDPAFEDAIIASQFGIDINKIDRLAEAKRSLDVKIVEWAIDAIENDADLRGTIVRAKAFELVNLKDPALEPKPPPPPKPDPVEELIKTAQRVDAVKEALGLKRNFWSDVKDTFNDPKVVAALITSLPNFFPRQPASPVPGNPVNVGVNIGVGVSEPHAEEPRASLPLDDQGFIELPGHEAHPPAGPGDKATKAPPDDSHPAEPEPPPPADSPKKPPASSKIKTGSRPKDRAINKMAAGEPD